MACMNGVTYPRGVTSDFIACRLIFGVGERQLESLYKGCYLDISIWTYECVSAGVYVVCMCVCVFVYLQVK